jgi:hypothetical protein
MVRFRFAADAAFLMFFFAAFVCLVETIVTRSIAFPVAVQLLVKIFQPRIYAALSAAAETPA